MANVTFTPQDYSSTLAMLFHEAGGPAVQNLLKRGDSANALGYVAGLIDTWANRSAATGRPMWQLMNERNQISHWDPSQIQQKANNLDPRIKALADAYLTNRADGGKNFNPGVVNYMNTEFVKDDNPNGSWKDWYDPKNVVAAYGDYKPGRNSLETQFITQPKKQPVPDYTFSFDKSLKLAPTDAAQQAYSTLAGRLAGLKPPQPGGDGFGAGTDVSGDVGNGSFGSASGVLETGQPYWFSQGDFSTGVGNGSLGTGIIPYNTIDPRSFAGRFAVGDALGGGDGSLNNPGGVVETGDPYAFSTGDALQSYYRNALGREADPQGLADWQGRIHPGGLTLGQALDQIASSPEAAARAAFTGVDPRTYAIADAYASQLNRLPDQQGLTSWMQQLSQGASLDSVLNRISNSPEAQRADLTSFYQNALRRPADASGLQYALDQLAGGRSLQAVETSILSSPEAQALGITPDQYARYLSADDYGAPTVGPPPTTYPLGPGGTTYPVAPGSTTYPIGPGGFEIGTVPPGPTQGTINTGTEVSPVGPDGFEVKPVGPEGSEVGTVPPPALSPEVRNFYETYLHRAPDAQGAVEYQGQIDRGVPLSLIEAQILSAPEAVQALTPEEMANQTAGYKAKYGLLPEEVKTLAPLASDFARVVGRPVDTPTLQYWDQQIDAGTPQSILEAQILTAPETQALGLPALTQAVQDYHTQYALKPEEVTAIGPLASEFARVLDRPADIPTIQAWDAQLDAGATMPELQARLLQAPEVLGRTGGAGDAYTAFQGQYGRSPSDYLAGLTDPTKFSGANVSGNLGPGTWNGTFDPSAYLAANPDVAAAGANPLAHFVQFGLSEGRSVDTAGHHLPQNFDGNAYLAQNPDVARAGMSPLDHYLRFGAAEGRAAPTGTNNYSFTNLNASQGLGPVGNGTFSGTFDGNSYLAANRDVAASGMSPLDHYLRYGYGEGRAIDTQGDRISGFDGTAYLAANRDVAMAGMDPLRHYLMSGAAEGRAAPTGSNNYSFSNFNVAGGLGNPGTGSFGLGGITSSAPGGMGTMAPAQTPAPQASGAINPFGFSSLNAGTYAAPSLGGVAGGGGSVDWESAAGNALPGSGFGSGSAFAYKDSNGNDQIATFDPKKSENAYLAGQVAQNQAQIEAGRSPFANNPNLWNASFAQQNFVTQAQNQFAPTPFFTATPATYALPSPVAPTAFMPPPVMNQGLRVNPYGGFGLISAF